MSDPLPCTPISPAGASKPQNESAVPAGGESESATKRPDPTRYGDWEKNGRCIDF
ncbi:MAG: DUF1674 domain-containing protein [Rhodanobacteraceae bacterium]